MKPVKNPSLKLFHKLFPSIAYKRGTNANQARNSRSKFGKERIRRIPERRLKKKPFFLMPHILRNKKIFFKKVRHLTKWK